LHQTPETTAPLQTEAPIINLWRSCPKQQTSPFQFLTLETQQGSTVLVKFVKLFILAVLTTNSAYEKCRKFSREKTQTLHFPDVRLFLSVVIMSF